MSFLKSCFAQQATTWHDDYNRFRAGVKDLEVMVQNLISSAFETITTVQEGVEILDIFQHLSSREVKHFWKYLHYFKNLKEWRYMYVFIENNCILW